MTHKSVHVLSPARIVFGAVTAWAVMTHWAAADLTVEALTAGAVSEVGAFYQDVEDAIRDFAAKDYGRAFAHLESAKKSTPRLAPPEVMMAQLYFDSNQPAGAFNMLERVIRRLPQDPEALVMFGERAVLEGRLTEAGLSFDKASKVLEKFSESPRRKQYLQARLYSGSATVDEVDGNLGEAQKKLEELVKVAPRNAIAHDRLGRVMFKLADQRRAYAEFQAAAEIDKGAVPAELTMASLSTDKLKADNWMNKALNMSGKDLRTRLGAADYLLRNNRIEEAKAQADEALKIDPKGLESNLLVGVIGRMLGDFKTAEPHLAAAHLLAPGNPVISNHLALVLLESADVADHKRALQYADVNARQNPNSPELIAALGWINFRLNRRAEAKRAFQTVLSLPSQANQSMTSEMGFYMAHLAKESGKITEAMRILKEALNNNEPFAYRKQAEEMLAQLGKLEKSPTSKSKGSGATKGTEANGKTGKPEETK